MMRDYNGRWIKYLRTIYKYSLRDPHKIKETISIIDNN